MAPLKVLVGVKRVIDFAVKVRVAPGGHVVQEQGVKHSLNPFCEIALEEAVRMRERGEAAEVIAATVGSRQSQDALRTALALGADRAVLVELPGAGPEQGAGPGAGPGQGAGPPLVAAALAKLVEREKPQLVLLGKQAIDDDCNQTGQILAAILDWSQGTFLSRLELDPGSSSVRIQREVDGGLEQLRLQLPTVLTADLRLNQPRYATLPNIMKAKKKPLEVQPLEQLLGGPVPPPRLRVLRLEEPPVRQGAQRVESVPALLERLAALGRI
ncbi:electron transfer flavoprotein subunit beta [Melopsittacus undulatus]|uniref:Electron transfer flavoprotein subunit beta n=1 Tax=Melopsittacus undulatus TaxID=13146 RepID=A0A8V5GQS1_MELUD|nr:electron transfer flavoprotein subunit beta [Melopsittacus undulatus]